MRKHFGWMAGLALALGMGGALAATPKAPSQAQVRQLMDAMGVDHMLGQMNTQMAAMMQEQLPCVPASYWQDFIDAAGARELTERMVPIYQRHFTATEIEGLLKFYRSPLGKKVIAEMPATMAEGMQLGQEWGRERAQAMLSQLQKSGRVDAQGQCPAAPSAPAGAALVEPAAAGSTRR